jgi:hypothetical protein
MNACDMKFRLITGISIYLACLSQFSSSPRLSAAESPMTFTTGDLPQSTHSKAFLTNSGVTSAGD